MGEVEGEQRTSAVSAPGRGSESCLRAAEVTSRELRAAPNSCPQPQRTANPPAFLRTVGCVRGLCRALDCSPTPKVQGADCNACGSCSSRTPARCSPVLRQ